MPRLSRYSIRTRTQKINDSIYNRHIFEDLRAGHTDRVYSFFDDVSRPLDLLEWVKKYKNRAGSVKDAKKQLISATSIKYFKKTFKVKFTILNSSIYVEFKSYLESMTCFCFDISLKTKQCYVHTFKPYLKGCPESTSKIYFEMLDLICRVLRIEKSKLEDGATTNLFKNEPRIETFDGGEKYAVNLSAITILLKGSAYYEQFGYQPVDETEKEKLKEVLQITDFSVSKKLHGFLADFKYTTIGEFLKACLKAKDSKPELLTDKIKETLVKCINKLTLPRFYVKKYVYSY